MKKFIISVLLGVFIMSAAENADAATFVTLKTSMGDIVMELYPEKAPITVENFVGYVQSGFFNGTIFHRVIPNFMIQGGGFTEDMEQKDNGEPIKNEASNKLSNKKYTVAMARTQVPDSATSQFFINTVDNPYLDYTGGGPQGAGYAVFGKVIKGMDVVDKIGKVKTTRKAGHADVPAEAVTIIEATVNFDAKK